MKNKTKKKKQKKKNKTKQKEQNKKNQKKQKKEQQKKSGRFQIYSLEHELWIGVCNLLVVMVPLWALSY